MKGKMIRRTLLGHVYDVKKQESSVPPEVPERDYDVIEYDYIPIQKNDSPVKPEIKHEVMVKVKSVTKIFTLIRSKSATIL